MSIRIEDVSHIYDKGYASAHIAIEQIHLEIEDGEFIGIIGHTGSGKSTLVQHLNGLMEPTSGRIFYNNQEIHKKEFNRKQLRQKVGLVFQYPEHQLFEVDVISDVMFGPKNLGLSEEEAKKRALDALELVGLEEAYYRQSPFDLSGGQKRRVAIAGVLAMKPEVLILDEPTAGLDPKGRMEILDQMKELQSKTNITVLLVSHSMEDVAEYVNRMIVMKQGRILYDDIPSQIFQYYRELEEIGLAAPQVTYLMRRLVQEGFLKETKATTIQEATDEIMKVFDRSKHA
ncbi:MAG: energy-coupling factor transporter ATPase [Eubacteriales bacterium]